MEQDFANDGCDARHTGVDARPAAVRSEPNLLLGLRRGISRRCPACGKGRLFAGYLAVIPLCAACGSDNEQYPSDDFAPYVTIFLALHLMVPLLFAADRAWGMPVGLEMGLAIPTFLAATLAVLPFAKGRRGRFRVVARRRPQPGSGRRRGLPPLDEPTTVRTAARAPPGGAHTMIDHAGRLPRPAAGWRAG